MFGVYSRTFGPDSCTSRWGITSLLITCTSASRSARIRSDGVHALPVTDHAWQPRIWWRIVIVLTPCADAPAAGAAANTVTPSPTRTPRTHLRLRLIVASFVVRSVDCRRRGDIRVRAHGH